MKLERLAKDEHSSLVGPYISYYVRVLYYIRVKRFDMDKPSSLFGSYISCKKSFVLIVLGVVFTTLHFVDRLKMGPLS